MQFIEGYDTNVSIVSLAAHILLCQYVSAPKSFHLLCLQLNNWLYQYVNVQNMMTIDGAFLNT